MHCHDDGVREYSNEVSRETSELRVEGVKKLHGLVVLHVAWSYCW
jgi:hypothetical protein